MGSDDSRQVHFPLEMDPRPALGYWAPGSYFNKCAKCGTTFVGDKRAGHCAPCAYGPFAALASPSHPVPTDVSQMIPAQKDKTIRTGPKEEFNLDWIIESFVLCLATLQNCPKPVHAGRVRNHVLSAKEFIESDAKMFSLLSDPVRTGVWKSAKRIGQAIYDTYGMDELHQIVDNLTDRQSAIADKVLDGVGKENDRWWC